MIAIVAAGALYAFGVAVARRRGRRIPARAIAAFAAALAGAAAAIAGPLDARADASLSWHMVQHLVLISLVAPLVVLGAPLRVALASLPRAGASALTRALEHGPLRFATHPAVAWLQFAFVLYAVHFSPLYEAALENETVHAAEHALFLTSAILFWTPLLAVAPAPHAPSHPVRLLAIFLAIPMGAFLGFALYVTRHVLYAHYVPLPGALDDQMNAGAVMWLAGGTPLVVALLWTLADWHARDAHLPEAFRP